MRHKEKGLGGASGNALLSDFLSRLWLKKRAWQSGEQQSLKGKSKKTKTKNKKKTPKKSHGTFLNTLETLNQHQQLPTSREPEKNRATSI